MATTPAPWHRSGQASASADGEHVRHDQYPPRVSTRSIGAMPADGSVQCRSDMVTTARPQGALLSGDVQGGL
jgi:hypothetical protein